MSESIEIDHATDFKGESEEKSKEWTSLPLLPLISGAKSFVDLADAGIRCRKGWQEAGAAKEQRQLLSSIKKHVDPLAEKASNFMDSGTELNKTCAGGMRDLVDVSEDCLARTAQAAEDISQNLGSASQTAAEAFGVLSSSAKATKETAETMTEGINNLSKNINNVHIVANSMLKHTVHLLQEAVAELRMINQNLKGIKDELGAHNTLISMGGASPDGFAPVVHGFVYLHIQKNHSGDGGCQKNGHMFFVWHPDNTWHWRFEQLLKEKPLPAAFCAYSDDLDSLCALMKEVRRMLPNGSSPVVFHLLIPAWYKIDVKEPLHFPDELQPLRIAGMRHSGKPLVSFNLPAAQENLLDGVANVLDPEGHNMRAEIAGAATFLVGGGWGTNGVCLATGVFLGGITGLGALVAIPVWCGGFMSVGAPAAAYAAQTIHGALRENAPRIIGSDDRLARRSC